MEPSIPDPQFVYPLRSTWPYLTSTLAPILDFSHCPISCYSGPRDASNCSSGPKVHEAFLPLGQRMDPAGVAPSGPWWRGAPAHGPNHRGPRLT